MRVEKRKLLGLAVLMALSLANAASLIGRADRGLHQVPSGRNILPNGRFPAGEWEDAVDIETTGEMTFHLKADDSYLYLGIKFLGPMHTGIDLYLGEPGGTRKKLHVSAALGEADWKDGSWTDIQWGKNTLWTANSIGTIIENGERKVVPLEGFEFQISRALLPGSRWLLFVHLKRPELLYPHGAGPLRTEGWLRIEF